MKTTIKHSAVKPASETNKTRITNESLHKTRCETQRGKKTDEKKRKQGKENKTKTSKSKKTH